MSVEKRNALASMASQYVPSAIEQLRTADQNIRDNKPHEALNWIAQAQRQLDDLKSLSWEPARKGRRRKADT
jgi:hypothetical protein